VAFAERNIRIKYKQAALRIAWTVIQALVFMAILTLTIGRFAGISGVSCSGRVFGELNGELGCRGYARRV
jgi:ABC-type polysaccharide/polyol phosphate export permease